jgi:hypothetical protein
VAQEIWSLLRLQGPLLPDQIVGELASQSSPSPVDVARELNGRSDLFELLPETWTWAARGSAVSSNARGDRSQGLSIQIDDTEAADYLSLPTAEQDLLKSEQDEAMRRAKEILERKYDLEAWFQREITPYVDQDVG